MDGLRRTLLGIDNKTCDVLKVIRRLWLVCGSDVCSVMCASINFF